MNKINTYLKKNTGQFIVFLIGAVLFMFSCGYYNVPLASWVFPVFLLFFYRNSKNRLLVLLATAIMVALSYFKFQGVLGSQAGDNILCLITSSIILIPLFLDRWFYGPIKRKFGWLSMLLFPAVYATISIFEKNYIGMGRMISFSQTGTSSLIQNASVIGSSGLIVIICLCSTTILYCYEKYLEKKTWTKPAIAYVCIIAVLLVSGSLILTLNKVLGDETVRIAMAQTSQDVGFTTEDDGADLNADIEYIKKQAERASKGEAKILVFGEEAFYIASEEKEEILNASKDIAKNNNIYLTINLETLPPEDGEETREANELYLISNTGEIAGHYVKANLMPELEDKSIIKGDGEILYREIPYGNEKSFNASFVLCYDADLQLYLTTCNDNTDIIFVPSWGWDLIDPYHTNVMRMRAIENGMPIVNAAVNVKSAAIDWQGNNIAISDCKTTGLDHVTFADVPIKADHSTTVYRIIAPYIMWGLLAVSIIFVIMGIVLLIKEAKA